MEIFMDFIVFGIFLAVIVLQLSPEARRRSWSTMAATIWSASIANAIGAGPVGRI